MDKKCLHPLYPSLIGNNWSALDPRLKRFYSADGERRGTGVFQIHHGPSMWARILARILRLPKEAPDVPTRLRVMEANGSAGENHHGEIWNRSFGNRELNSIQYANNHGMLAERFTLTELWFRLEVVDSSLVFVTAGGALVVGPIRIRLPIWLCPRVMGRATSGRGNRGRFNVSVNLAVPLIGLVLSYEGYIDPEVGNS
jgi:hypothetical protein